MNQNPTGRTIGPARQCQRKHCTSPATCIPVIRVPAMGCPIPEHEPIIARLNIPLCDGCFENLNVGEFLNKRFKRIVSATCKSAYKASPDFGRAFKEKGTLP